MTAVLLVLSLIWEALPCYSSSSLVTSETCFLGGIMMVTTLPLILAVYSLWNNFLSLNTSMEWSMSIMLKYL